MARVSRLTGTAPRRPMGRTDVPSPPRTVSRTPRCASMTRPDPQRPHAGTDEASPTGAIYRGRYTAAMPEDFVVFLIGMRLNRPWKVHRWLPAFSAMPRMLRWLERHPEAGLLKWHNAWINGPAVVQYWRSFEQLNALPGPATSLTCRYGSGSTTPSGDAATSASGTRPTRCAPESTNASTSACRASASRPRVCTLRLARPANPPHAASAPPPPTNRRSPRTPTLERPSRLS